MLLICLSNTPVFGANIRATNETDGERFVILEDITNRTIESVALESGSSRDIITTGSASLACLDTTTRKTTRISSPKPSGSITTLTITDKGIFIALAPVTELVNQDTLLLSHLKQL